MTSVNRIRERYEAGDVIRLIAEVSDGKLSSADFFAAVAGSERAQTLRCFAVCVGMVVLGVGFATALVIWAR